jgi:hypothetical protein
VRLSTLQAAALEGPDEDDAAAVDELDGGVDDLVLTGIRTLDRLHECEEYIGG